MDTQDLKQPSEYEIALNEAGEQFNFPDEEIPADLASRIDDLAKEKAKALSNVFVYRLCEALLSSYDPKVELISLLYLSGFDMPSLIGCKENTHTSIAERLKIAPSTLWHKIQRAAKRCRIDYVHANRGHRTQRPRGSQLSKPRCLKVRGVKDERAQTRLFNRVCRTSSTK